MHDPHTQAFVIPYRYRWSTLGKTPWRYWVPLFTIWHRDPERGGSDDSCGWFTPPFTEAQRDFIKQLAGDEARDPWFQSLSAERNPNPVECEVLVRGAFLLVSMCLVNRCGARPVTLEEATRWAAEMTHNSIDNFRNSLSFKSGYHSNWYKEGVQNSPKQDEWWREEQARGFFGAVLGKILRERRPWYRHPRWHLHHWEIQNHLLQSFKRWAFTRCDKCGGRFAWGASGVSGSWNGTGPRWFKSEQLSHMDCSSPGLSADACCAKADVTTAADPGCEIGES